MARRSFCTPTAKGPGICPPRRNAKALRTYDQVVDDYIANCRGPAAEELDFFASQSSRNKLIELIAFAKTSQDKRHPHHQRRTQTTLKAVHRHLVDCDFSGCKTFDELLALLNETIGHIQWVGPLFIYDAALHLGAYLNRMPKRVYLHTGTRIGAAAMGLGIGRDTLEPSELPGPFRRLQPHEIEDCLCIYKKDLARIYAKLQRAR